MCVCVCVYVCVSLCVSVHVFINPFRTRRMQHKVTFLTEKDRFQFRVFLLLDWWPRLKNPVCSTILPIAGGWIVGLPRVLTQYANSIV